MTATLRVDVLNLNVTPHVCTARLALLELAAEAGLSTKGLDDGQLQTMVQTHLLNTIARTRFLESTDHVLRVHRVPNLEGQVRELTLDRNSWSDRAIGAELALSRMNWLSLGVVVILSAAIVFLVATRLPR